MQKKLETKKELPVISAIHSSPCICSVSFINVSLQRDIGEKNKLLTLELQ